MDVAGKQRFFCLFVFVGQFHLAKTFENVCATKQKSHFPFLYHFNGFIMAKFSTRRSGLFKFLAERPWGSLMPLKQWLLSPLAESECLWEILIFITPKVRNNLATSAWLPILIRQVCNWLYVRLWVAGIGAVSVVLLRLIGSLAFRSLDDYPSRIRGIGLVKFSCNHSCPVMRRQEKAVMFIFQWRLFF